MNGTPIDARAHRASPLPRVAVLGAGPAGVAAGYALARDRKADVTVVEKRGDVGGNAASFMVDGVWCDFGSHRLHPVAEPRVLDDLRSLLGDDLLWRPRHGRIRLKGRWIHFPLKPFDLLLRLPKSFALTLALGALRNALPRAPVANPNFATTLQHGLGTAMCESFYFPYVRKLWGVAPEDLVVTLAERRVSGSSIGKILAKVARQLPGLRTAQAGGFYYPRDGFGQISQSLHTAATAFGVEFAFDATVNGIDIEDGRVTAVRYRQNGQDTSLRSDIVWSTLPISLLIHMIDPPAPPAVRAAADSIRFRGMILIYLVLEQPQFSAYDAHYFPESTIPISRMSEPKNYRAAAHPAGQTVLCAELPSDPGQPEWALTDQDLGARLCGWLASVDLPVDAPVKTVVTRRLAHAYPVYDRDYERHFEVMDSWLSEIGGLLTFGRQGLFAHDNTHHAMAMAYAAADCLRPDGTFDRNRWSDYRVDFKSHVVED